MVGVVVGPPVGGEHLGLIQAGEDLDVQQLVAPAVVEGLDVGVLPGRARLDVGGVGGAVPAPFAKDGGSQLGAVVGAAEQVGDPFGGVQFAEGIPHGGEQRPDHEDHRE